MELGSISCNKHYVCPNISGLGRLDWLGFFETSRDPCVPGAAANLRRREDRPVLQSLIPTLGYQREHDQCALGLDQIVPWRHLERQAYSP